MTDYITIKIIECCLRQLKDPFTRPPLQYFRIARPRKFSLDQPIPDSLLKIVYIGNKYVP